MIYLYLFDAISIEQLPDELRQKALKYRREGNKVGDNTTIHYNHMTRYFKIVSLDTNRLELAEEMAKLLYENKLTIKNFNREQLIRIFGEDEANRVFPEREAEEITKTNFVIASSIEITINELINKKGWRNDNELIENIHISDFDIERNFKNSLRYIKDKKSSVIDNIEVDVNNTRVLKWFHNYMKKKLSFYLPSILKDSNIKKYRVNHKLKLELNINNDIRGYIYHRAKIIENNKDKIIKIKS